MKSDKPRVDIILLCAVLVGLVLFAFTGATDCGFVFDDGIYILDNPQVLAGLSWSAVSWAFTTLHGGNWHPLTWLSHASDVHLYRLNPTGHHLTSVLLHALNAVLLLLVLRAMTGSTWRGALVAAVFAVHPLRLESVAWISERKDLLAAFFWLLTMWAYLAHARRPSTGRYAFVLASFALGLMAKPMLVTLPIVLILIDYWPLARGQGTGDSGQKATDTRHPTPGTRLLLEKLPMLAMAAAAGVVTLIAQRGWGNVAEHMPIGVRAANASVALVAYLRKMLWPSDLAVYYPHPGTGIPVWQTVGSAALLVAVTCLIVRGRRLWPHAFVGWLWYLIVLLPVIGLAQVGDQSMADRYTYLPMIGLLIAFAWSLPEPSTTIRRAAIALPAVAILALLTAQTRQDTRYWISDEALFTRALQVTRNNWTAHYGLARALGTRRDYKGAEFHAREALRLNPDSLDARIALGVAMMREGRADAAVAELNRVVDVDPDNTLARINLAAALNKAGRSEDARYMLIDVLEADPEQARRVLARYGKYLEFPPEWISP
jgi:hypothetical protein